MDMQRHYSNMTDHSSSGHHSGSPGPSHSGTPLLPGPQTASPAQMSLPTLLPPLDGFKAIPAPPHHRVAAPTKRGRKSNATTNDSDPPPKRTKRAAAITASNLVASSSPGGLFAPGSPSEAGGEIEDSGVVTDHYTYMRCMWDECRQAFWYLEDLLEHIIGPYGASRFTLSVLLRATHTIDRVVQVIYRNLLREDRSSLASGKDVVRGANL